MRTLGLLTVLAMEFVLVAQVKAPAASGLTGHLSEDIQNGSDLREKKLPSDTDVSLMANKRYNKRSGRKWESKEKRDGNKWQSKEKRDGNKWQSKEKRDGNKWQNKDKRDGNKWQNKDKRDGNKWQNKDKRDGNKWQSKDKRDGKKWFSGLVINNKHGGHKRQIA